MNYSVDSQSGGAPPRRRRRLVALLQKVSRLVQRILPDHGCFRARAGLYRLAGFRVAPDCRICGTVEFVYDNLSIGRNTFIGQRVAIHTNIHGGVFIGDDVDVAPHVVLHSGTHLQDNFRRRAGTGAGNDIAIGNGSWIGVRAVILYGTKIGRRCIVAPGAVVRGIFPDDVLIGGVPGRVIKSLETSDRNATFESA